MNIRAEFPDLAAIQEASQIDQFEILVNFDDNCYNSEFLEKQYGEIVRNLIEGCIERGQLDRQEFQNNLRDILDRTSLSPSECIDVVWGVLRERFAKAALPLYGDISPALLTLASVASSPFAGHEYAPAAGLTLPEAAPERYENRERPESSVDYYDRVWRKYADAGVLYQDQLRKLDPKLIPAIHTHCSRQRLDPKDHLPPPRHERTKRLAAIGDVSAIANLHNAERLRSWRHKQEPPPL